MGQGTLTIYSASAGSGKTFNLAGIYLARLFKSKYNYRKILAVTFTNKATAEMKSRILDQLHLIATGRKSEYLPELIKSTGKKEEELRKEAGDILFSILHDFSRFSICTIDSFFQKVIRAFAKESGLHSGFNIELDHSIILSEAVDEMIAASDNDPELNNWLNNFVMSNLDEEKSWNLKGEIVKLAEELFREKFKILSVDEKTNLGNKKFLLEYVDDLKKLSSSFIKKMSEFGTNCQKIFSDNELSDEMFYQKSKGVPGFIKSLVSGKLSGPNKYVREATGINPKWSTGEPCGQLRNAINGGLGEILKESIAYFDENIINYNTAEAILKNIFALGILSDVLKQVREIASSENSFFISDAGEILNLITREDQAPFIYEKIGNSYDSYMIDEFQDTSFLQWNNFNPLIAETMDSGNDNLVVGDLKQSIYRFRNSDWQILGRMKEEMVDNVRFLSRPLKTNWRSRSNIIRFNNSLFSVIPEQLDRSFSEDPLSLKFKKLYSEAVQEDPGKRKGGFVRLEFIDDETEEQQNSKGRSSRNVTKKWREKVLEKLPSVIETFLDKGYNASDIGILVRDGRDGADVLTTMIKYSNDSPPEKKARYNYNIVSSDSLILSNSPAITFIISTIKVLNDPSDMISRAQMIRFFLMATGDINAEKASLFHEDLVQDKYGYLPEDCETFLRKASQMTLFEATENIIGYFGLGTFTWNVSYLDTFQDLVLNFSGSKNSDFQSFLDWWEKAGNSKSVILPSNQDAAKVMTIHKAKGLEFKIVIIPFLSWNIDHKSQHLPIMWIKPQAPPFNKLGIVPVRYQKALSGTIFAHEYAQEKYSACLDNLNLLYVAMTRAVDAIWGFAPETPSINNAIAGVIKNAVISDENPAVESGMVLSKSYKAENKVFEFGEIPENIRRESLTGDILSRNYVVSSKPGSLRLKLHGENYFIKDREDIRQKINYGKLMHEVFEGIYTIEDVPGSVNRLVMEGKILASESDTLNKRLKFLIDSPEVSDWFRPGNIIMKEAEILLPSAITRRPDRVIIRDDKVIIVDFKFGEENKNYADQVRQYKEILIEMGYKNIEAFLWYVDKNKIVRA